MSSNIASNPAPGFKEKPDHRIELAPAGRPMQAVIGSVIVAQSSDVMALHEANYAPIYYFPRADVNMALLSRTDHKTHCPFKGDASYWTVAAGDRSEVNAAWSYEAPFDEMRAIAGMIAFYQDRVKLGVD